MDPLVRVAIGMQRLLAATNGVVLALAAGVMLTRYPGHEPLARVAMAAVVAGSFAVRLRRRLRDAEHPSALRDVELGLHAAVLAYAAVFSAPLGVTGPYHAVVYAVLCITAGVSSLPTVVATVSMMLALELGFAVWSPDRKSVV